MRALFVATVAGLPFAIFMLATWLRRVRYRALAPELGAKHERRGWFAPGALSGSFAGERFEIDAAKVGKTYRTLVKLELDDGPGSYWIRPGFFGASPDWSCVRVPGVHVQRAFLWEVAFRGAVEPTREQQERLLAWLGRSAFAADTRAAMEAAGVREVDLEERSISASLRGIVTDPERLRRALEALRRLARAGRARAAA